MDDTIKIRGGSGETPELQDRELGYNRNEKALCIGTPDGNVRLCGAGDISEAKEYADELILGAKRYIDGLMVEVNKRLAALEKPEEPEPEPEEPETPEEGEVNG